MRPSQGRQKFVRMLFGVLIWIVEFIFSCPCFAYQSDSWNLSTFAGSGYLNQSFEFSRHFLKADDELANNFVLRQRNENQGARWKEGQGLLPLSWNLGVAYNRAVYAATSTDPEIVDPSYRGSLGLNWDPQQNFNVTANIMMESIPDESCMHGDVYFRIEYLIGLKKKGSSKKGRIDLEDLEKSSKTGGDAASYYETLRENKMSEVQKKYSEATRARRPASLAVSESPTSPASPASEDDLDELEGGGSGEGESSDAYPNLRVAYHFGFGRHSVQSHVLRRVSRLGTSSLDTSLDQYRNGPEVIYSPTERWSFRVSASFYSYSDNVDSFFMNLDALPGFNPNGVVNGRSSALTGQIFVLPSFVVEGSIDWHASDSDSFAFNLSQVSYSSSVQTNTLGMNPVYLRDLGKQWRLGLGTTFTMSANSSLSVLGSMDLIHRLSF